jgi:hypothetical protein
MVTPWADKTGTLWAEGLDRGTGGEVATAGGAKVAKVRWTAQD